MKLFSSVFSLILVSQALFGQNTVNQEFTGIIAISGGEKISYKLIIEEIENGIFRGFTLSNFEGEDYTKTKIKGKLSLDDLSMSFEELDNVETKSSAEASTFCYVSAPNLKIRILKNKNIIAGKFLGLFPSGEECAGGIILLTNGGELRKIEEMNAEQPVAIKKMPAKKSLEFDSVLTSNEKLEIVNRDNKISLEVWDGYFQDDDRISIYLNNELIQENLVLRNDKQVIALPQDKSKYLLKIVALNEGSSGINTVNFRLKNSSEVKEFVSMLRKGESFSIDFKKD
ncbi:MAG: hypothetical protein RLN79_07860 [Cytophagales bacterium]